MTDPYVDAINRLDEFEQLVHECDSKAVLAKRSVEDAQLLRKLRRKLGGTPGPNHIPTWKPSRSK